MRSLSGTWVLLWCRSQRARPFATGEEGSLRQPSFTWGGNLVEGTRQTWAELEWTTFPPQGRAPRVRMAQSAADSVNQESRVNDSIVEEAPPRMCQKSKQKGKQDYLCLVAWDLSESENAVQSGRVGALSQPGGWGGGDQGGGSYPTGRQARWPFEPVTSPCTHRLQRSTPKAALNSIDFMEVFARRGVQSLFLQQPNFS